MSILGMKTLNSINHILMLNFHINPVELFLKLIEEIQNLIIIYN